MKSEVFANKRVVNMVKVFVHYFSLYTRIHAHAHTHTHTHTYTYK